MSDMGLNWRVKIELKSLYTEAVPTVKISVKLS